MEQQPKFKHKLVQGLYELLQEWMSSGQGGASLDPLKMMWKIIGPELPYLLRDLDDSPESVEAIRSKLASVLVEEEPIPAEAEQELLLEEESQEEREREEGQEV